VAREIHDIANCPVCASIVTSDAYRRGVARATQDKGER
jgi:hypothetical protein